MISILNYGMGNLGSITNMFDYIGVECQIVSDSNQIEQAEKLLLPGVGAFDAAMNKINEAGIREVLDKKALVDKIPILGVCLGMQLLTKGSEEGNLPGLGWIPANTKKFIAGATLKVPHMGWNEVDVAKQNPILENINATSQKSENARFYFVHSYYVETESDQFKMLKTNYGLTFDSGIQNNNVMGCQFHPEKSHKFGMQLLKNFAKL